MVFKDQLNRTIHLSAIPKRIVSLVPSQTELLFDLELNEEIIGITKFCVHPEREVRNKTRIGGTKNVNIKKVASLLPDLIIANKEENNKSQIEELEKIAPVWISDINSFDDALTMIEQIGLITDKRKKAKEITEAIISSFSQLKTKKAQVKTCYLIWKDPYMTIGGDTFINNMLGRCGLKNVFEDKERYPEITLQQLSLVSCQLILLASEPYPFAQKHITQLKTYLPDAQILLVDGEMFSWYGSRMLYAAKYFQQMINSILC